MARHVVTFHYSLRDTSDRVLDLSFGGPPVAYLEGAGQIIDGLEEALRDRQPGSQPRIIVPAAKAYGEYDAALVRKIRRDDIPVRGELRVGGRFRIDASPGAPVVTVAAIEGGEVTLDANHPLAGMDLSFDVDIVEVREATGAEIAQGHPDAPAGCEGCDCGDDCASEGSPGGCGCGGRGAR
ncbi:MAG: peptidylprolyl isomerase [Opitutaceae bacterium]|jgi:FKBP-type peptidyl-prolyl cis-trans isomerase SlyD|nr:peptidylprolyl isomerase [Opitutaceae bacterium]